MSSTEPLKEEFIIEGLGDIAKSLILWNIIVFNTEKIEGWEKMGFVIVVYQSWKTMLGSWALTKNRLSCGNYYPNISLLEFCHSETQCWPHFPRLVILGYCLPHVEVFIESDIRHGICYRGVEILLFLE